MYKKLIYRDERYDFYVEPINQKLLSLVIQDKRDKVVIDNESCYIGYGKEVEQKVYKGKVGETNYYRVTFESDELKQEVVYESKGKLRLVYEDASYVNKEEKLVIRCTKGGLNVRRRLKNDK